jgi:uncharacterized protein YunC (DUF1805 family)
MPAPLSRLRRPDTMLCHVNPLDFLHHNSDTGSTTSRSGNWTIAMAQLPSHSTRELEFNNGTALGVSNRWEGGQYCSILTKAGIVGCGIYDMETAAEFSQAIAIAKGTPAKPLVEPEDLFEAKIVNCTPKARTFGIEVGMTGREAVERMLAVSVTNDEHEMSKE